MYYTFFAQNQQFLKKTRRGTRKNVVQRTRGPGKLCSRNVHERRGVNKAVFWTTSESLQTVVFSSYRCSSQPPRTVCCPSNQSLRTGNLKSQKSMEFFTWWQCRSHFSMSLLSFHHHIFSKTTKVFAALNTSLLTYSQFLNY